jgi:hypothetical protein
VELVVAFFRKNLFDFSFSVIIKCEPALNTNENVEQGQKVVVRIPRIECNVK